MPLDNFTSMRLLEKSLIFQWQQVTPYALMNNNWAEKVQKANNGIPTESIQLIGIDEQIKRSTWRFSELLLKYYFHV